MNAYVKIMRPDHWVKQLFILPGFVCAMLLTKPALDLGLLEALVIGLIVTSLIASANYVINEWLDAPFDRFHPTKKYRTAVSGDVKGPYVWALWGILSLTGFVLGSLLGGSFLATLFVLWVMGLVYNVRPLRSKDIPYLDVLSESINNALRLMLGWLIVSKITLPPSSLLLGYWMAGAFLMAAKRLAEYRMIDDPAQAALYRRSFAFYNERSLLVSTFFYAMSATFFIGIFLVKYRIEYVLFVPILMGLFCYYLRMVFDEDSAAQRPEKLLSQRGLMVYCVVLCFLFVLCSLIDMPWLGVLTSNQLVVI